MTLNRTSRKVILASGSRFRKRMLESAGLAFDVQPASVDEEGIRAKMAEGEGAPEPEAVALKLATLKALEVSSKHPSALVIGADQVLALGDEIFGKPADVSAARAQLSQLRGRVHALPTAVVLAEGGQIVWDHVGVTELEMRAFTDAFLDDYLRNVGAGVLETVGGYMLEGLGAQLFERVTGDYFTVIGLPLLPLLAELRSRGVLRD